MGAVRLSRRVVLEGPSRLADGAGGYSESWTALGEMWAQVRPGSGRFANGQGGALSVSGIKVTVRAAPLGWESRPEPGQRFRVGQQRLRIEAVNALEPQAQYLVCHCKEEVTP